MESEKDENQRISRIKNEIMATIESIYQKTKKIAIVNTEVAEEIVSRIEKIIKDVDNQEYHTNSEIYINRTRTLIVNFM